MKPRALDISAAGIIISVLLGAFLGVSAHTADYAEATSYLSNDPAACVNCHVMREQFDGWQKGVHHAVAACNDCHVPHDFVGKYLAKAEHGYRHSKGFTLQDFHEPIQITPSDKLIVRDNCLRCHADLVSELAGGGHETDCLRCHVGVGHGPAK